MQSFSADSGEGDGTISIEYDANTGKAARTATFVVSTTATGVDKSSYQVVVTQAAPATGQEVEVTFTAGTDMTSSTAAGHEVLTKDGVTIDVSNGCLYTPEYRVYQNQTITVSAKEGTITKIEFNCTANGTSKYGPGNFSAGSGTYSYSGKKGTWIGSSNSVVLTASGSQVRASSIVVTVQ